MNYFSISKFMVGLHNQFHSLPNGGKLFRKVVRRNSGGASGPRQGDHQLGIESH